MPHPVRSRPTTFQALVVVVTSARSPSRLFEKGRCKEKPGGGGGERFEKEAPGRLRAGLSGRECVCVCVCVCVCMNAVLCW